MYKVLLVFSEDFPRDLRQEIEGKCDVIFPKMEKYAVSELHFFVQDKREYHRIPLGVKVRFSDKKKDAADLFLPTTENLNTLGAGYDDVDFANYLIPSNVVHGNFGAPQPPIELNNETL